MNENIEIQDNVIIHDFKPKRKTCAIIRVGGLGDCVALTAVARVLNERGYDVDLIFGSPTGQVTTLVEKLPFIHKVRDAFRVNNVDCVKNGENEYIAIEIIKEEYDEVFDLKFSIEDNRAGLNGSEGWKASINSNYMNWVDISLAWCNIDYTKISDEKKRPQIMMPDHDLSDLGKMSKYTDWVANETPVGMKSDYFDLMQSHRSYKVIGIQLQASSLTRSWYEAPRLPHILHEKYPDDIVLIYSQTSGWQAITKSGQVKLDLPEGYDPLCCSTALISQMDVFISADSGFSHVAEAVRTPNVTIYTTVPGWTRAKYYKFAHIIDALVPCSPCFNLDIFCPIEKKKAINGLTDREREIVKLGDEEANIFDVARKFGTVPKAIDDEYKSAKQRIQALSAMEPACVKSITSDMILQKVEEILCITTQQ